MTHLLASKSSDFSLDCPLLEHQSSTGEQSPSEASGVEKLRDRLSPGRFKRLETGRMPAIVYREPLLGSKTSNEASPPLRLPALPPPPETCHARDAGHANLRAPPPADPCPFFTLDSPDSPAFELAPWDEPTHAEAALPIAPATEVAPPVSPAPFGEPAPCGAQARGGLAQARPQEPLYSVLPAAKTRGTHVGDRWIQASTVLRAAGSYARDHLARDVVNGVRCGLQMGALATLVEAQTGGARRATQLIGSSIMLNGALAVIRGAFVRAADVDPAYRELEQLVAWMQFGSQTGALAGRLVEASTRACLGLYSAPVDMLYLPQLGRTAAMVAGLVGVGATSATLREAFAPHVHEAVAAVCRTSLTLA